MNTILSSFLALTLISNIGFAAGSTPDRSRSSGPDRGSDRSGSKDGSIDDTHGEYSPDSVGGTDRNWDDVDWSSGNRSGDSVDRREIDQIYIGKFLALRQIFQAVDQETLKKIKTTYEPEVALWATIGAGLGAAWIFIKTNPGQAALRAGNYGLRATAGLVLTMITYSANAGENYQAMADEDIFNLFDKKFWDQEAIQYALLPSFRTKIEKIMDVANRNLCGNTFAGNPEQIQVFCSYP